MDIKEFLPFIIVIAISIIGSLTKKKKQQGGQSQKKNIFETLMDELNGRNNPEVHEEPIYEVENYEDNTEEYLLETVVPVKKQVVTTADTATGNTVSLMDQFKERKRKNKVTGRGSIEVLEIDEEGKVQELRLEDPEEARKAIIYAEIIKPKYF